MTASATNEQTLVAARHTLIAACACMASIAMSITASAVALAQVQAEMSLGITELQWVQNAFILSFAVCLLPFGAMADRIGQRAPFLLGTFVFAMSTFAAVMATSLTALMIGRLLQGIGAALMAATGPPALTFAFADEAQRRRAFGYLGASGGIGLTLGAFLAGVAVSWSGWRAAFAVHLPFVVLALTAALRGFAGTQTSAGSFDLRATLVACARSRQFLLACAVCLLFTTVWVALFIYVPLNLQTAQARSGFDTGTTMLALMLPALIMPMVVSRLKERLSVGTVLIGGFLLMAGGLLALFFGWADPLRRELEVLGLLICGSGAGALYGLVDYLALTAVPPRQSSTASGVFNLVRLLGDALGAIVPATILLQKVRFDFAHAGVEAPRSLLSEVAAGRFMAVERMHATPEAARQLARLAAESFSAGVSYAVLALCALALIGAAVTRAFTPRCPAPSGIHRTCP